MSGRTRWGFDRAAGRKRRPVPLVRSISEARRMCELFRMKCRVAMLEAQADRLERIGAISKIEIISSSQGRAAAARPVHVRKVAGSSPAPATETSKAGGDTATSNPVTFAEEPVSRPADGLASAPERRITTLAAPGPVSRPQWTAPACRIDISSAPSGMVRTFEGKPMERTPAPALSQGMAYCRCHPAGLVPDWFGRDCIEPRCGLKACAS